MTREPCLGLADGRDFAGACIGCRRWEPAANPFEAISPDAQWVEARSEYGVSVSTLLCADRVALIDPPVHGVALSGIDGVAPIPNNREPVTRRFSARYVAGLMVFSLLAAATTAVLAAPCRWDNPGANPYRGDPASAVQRMTEIPADERRTLAAMVALDYGWQRVAVTRDGIEGAKLADLRGMNFGAGEVCAGPVDRSGWTAGRMESAKAYTVGRFTVLHFASCNNVALATNLEAMPEPLKGRALLDARRETESTKPAGPGLSIAPRVGPGFAVRAVPEPASYWLGMAALAAALGFTRWGKK